MRNPATDTEIILFTEAARPSDPQVSRDLLPGPDECWSVMGKDGAERFCRSAAMPGVSLHPACVDAMLKADTAGGR